MDENNHPAAVQIGYDDGRRIEAALEGPSPPRPPTNLSQHAGKLDRFEKDLLKGFKRIGQHIAETETLPQREDRILMTLTIKLGEVEAKELESTATRLGLTPEELARAAIADYVGQAAAAFERATAQVLEKNHSLYERLH